MWNTPSIDPVSAQKESTSSENEIIIILLLTRIIQQLAEIPNPTPHIQASVCAIIISNQLKWKLRPSWAIISQNHYAPMMMMMMSRMMMIFHYVINSISYSKHRTTPSSLLELLDGIIFPINYCINHCLLPLRLRFSRFVPTVNWKITSPWHVFFDGGIKRHQESIDSMVELRSTFDYYNRVIIDSASRTGPRVAAIRFMPPLHQ